MESSAKHFFHMRKEISQEAFTKGKGDERTASWQRAIFNRREFLHLKAHTCEASGPVRAARSKIATERRDLSSGVRQVKDMKMSSWAFAMARCKGVRRVIYLLKMSPLLYNLAHLIGIGNNWVGPCYR